MKYALIIHNFNQYGRSLTRFASLILLFAAMLSCGHESEVNKHKEVSHSAETGSDEIVKALVDELNQIDVGTDGEQVFSPPAIKQAHEIGVPRRMSDCSATKSTRHVEENSNMAHSRSNCA